MNVTTVLEISRRDLSQFFDALNDGVKLNSQEIRNSWYSEFAEQIRKVSLKHYDVFDTVVKQIKVKRRDHDQLIAFLAVSAQAEQFGLDIKNKMVDVAYGRNVDSRTAIATNMVSWEPFMDYTVETIKHFPSQSITKSTFVDVFNFMRQHGGLYINDFEQFGKLSLIHI